MNSTTVTYLAYLAISVSLTVWVAQTLHKNGRVFLVDVFSGNEQLADSVNHLLVVGFYLINLKQDYPVDLEIAPPEVQNRWTVFFRIILAIPALFVANILHNLSQLLAFFSLFVALFTGRVPEGIRNFGVLALRYESQTYAYIMLLTPRYPSFDVGMTE